jgi:hypothetical protein
MPLPKSPSLVPSSFSVASGHRAPSLLERYSFLRAYMPTYMHVVYVRGYAAISSSIERLPRLPASLRNTGSTCRLLG